MDLEEIFKNIMKLYVTINGKSEDVLTVYSGGDAGQYNWKIRIAAMEACGNNHIEAASKLLEKLKQELLFKIKFSENQITEYKKALNQARQN